MFWLGPPVPTDCDWLDTDCETNSAIFASRPGVASPPETYFEKIDTRLPRHGEDLARLQGNGILIDGEGVVDGDQTKVLLQIFSANAIGPMQSRLICLREYS